MPRMIPIPFLVLIIAPPNAVDSIYALGITGLGPRGRSTIASVGSQGHEPLFLTFNRLKNIQEEYLFKLVL